MGRFGACLAEAGLAGVRRAGVGIGVRGGSTFFPGSSSVQAHAEPLRFRREFQIPGKIRQLFDLRG